MKVINETYGECVAALVTSSWYGTEGFEEGPEFGDHYDENNKLHAKKKYTS